MGVRRRAVRERLAKKRARDINFKEFSDELDRLMTVVEDAMKEGLTRLSPEEFGRRLAAIAVRATPETGVNHD